MNTKYYNSNLIFQQLLSQFYSQKQRGFTLIELLVVVIIIGILAAIAIPNLIGLVGKGREAEAKNHLSIVTRSQQAYHYEFGEFSDTFGELNVAINNAKYFNFAIVDTSALEQRVKHVASPLNADQDRVRSYATGIYFVDSSKTYSAILCQGSAIGATVSVPDTDNNTCTNGIIIR